MIEVENLETAARCQERRKASHLGAAMWSSTPQMQLSLLEDEVIYLCACKN